MYMRRGSNHHNDKKLLAALMAVSAVAGGQASAAETLTGALTEGKAGLDFRLRYESVDQAGMAEEATAMTLRSRLDYTTGSYQDITGFVQFDDVTAITDDYNDATGLPSAKTNFPVVADPEGTEVNQAKLSYTGIEGTTITAGRQAVILDNARFVGNVGWRQNEQTYDGLTVVNTSLADTTIVYGYVTNVNRIFGEASSKGDINTETHLFNVGYTGLGLGKLSAYGYFLDLVDAPAASTSTLGMRFAGGAAVGEGVKALYALEYATQSDYKDGAATIDADYNLIEGGLSVNGVTAKIGMEVLGADGSAFSTPLATAHAFNGWADKFLATPANGLEDTYIKVSTKLAGVKLVAAMHDYSADQGGASYGDELNLLAAKKFGKNYTLLAKYASYSADTHGTDTDKLWLMAQASFK